jgi:beta-ribofuranosylaminobenzene 5'-phosphate synthase
MRTEPVRSIAVTSPSRLHFGLFSFGRPGRLQFGGVGAMVQSPGLRVSVRRGDDFEVNGVHADRARKFAELVLQSLCKQRACEQKQAELQRHLHINVEYAPREHIGMGVGTQLGLSVAAAICAACELRRPSAIDLARLSGRDPRSAIGTHGFDLGGLLVFGVSRFVKHVKISPDWHFVLFCPKTAIGISGQAEKTAFERLPRTPVELFNQLRHLALDELTPAAEAGDFARFSRGLYSFNHTAGSYFAPAQGGVFASERTTKLVERLRAMGVEGVGQSSWGPTVFALCESQPAAEDLLRQVRPAADAGDYECLISLPANQGAAIEVLPEE